MESHIDVNSKYNTLLSSLENAVKSRIFKDGRKYIYLSKDLSTTTEKTKAAKFNSIIKATKNLMRNTSSENLAQKQRLGENIAFLAQKRSENIKGPFSGLRKIIFLANAKRKLKQSFGITDLNSSATSAIERQQHVLHDELLQEKIPQDFSKALSLLSKLKTIRGQVDDKDVNEKIINTIKVLFQKAKGNSTNITILNNEIRRFPDLLPAYNTDPSTWTDTQKRTKTLFDNIGAACTELKNKEIESKKEDIEETIVKIKLQLKGFKAAIEKIDNVDIGNLISQIDSIDTEKESGTIIKTLRRIQLEASNLIQEINIPNTPSHDQEYNDLRLLRSSAGNLSAQLENLTRR